MPCDLTSLKVPHENAFGMSINDHEVEHLGMRVRRHRAQPDLSRQCRVSAEQQLLSGLASSIERSRDLSAAEGAIVE